MTDDRRGPLSLALRWAGFLCLMSAIPPAGAHARIEEVFEDFEGKDYGRWEVRGKAFGDRPAPGPLPGQMAVGGFRGKGLVNSFVGGDDATGSLTSPGFAIERSYISFLIGGGGLAGKTCMNLVVDGMVARTAIGPNAAPGGSEELEPAAWDVSDLKGKTARLVIVDEATGGWGHINVDHIVFTDVKPKADAIHPVRELVAERRYLEIPIKRGAKKRPVTVSVGDRVERRFDAELADDEPDWWASLDIAAWKGKPLAVGVDRLPEGSKALEAIAQGDALKGAEDLYREALRPRFHFSARRGWLNDPNGLVYFDGEYHLFFQHNPYGTEWGNMHWGHAVSPDLVHWQELGEALYPDEFGAMFSGSAVVDTLNTSGFGRDGKPPIVLIYTAAGRDVQCLAYSNDRGRSWTKFEGNPVVEKITGGNRDPKVIWHEPTKRWVMSLYVEGPDSAGKDDQGNPRPSQNIRFLSSKNLREWKPEGSIGGFFECPDLFELPIDGDKGKTAWVLTAANSEYMVGDFDGKTFTPSTPKLPGHRGKGFYAAQTYSDIPEKDGRRIQIGWLQAPSPGMPFNQAMSLPMVLSLRSTPDGPRLAWTPAKEIESLRDGRILPGSTSFRLRHEPLKLSPGDDPLAEFEAELAEVRLEFEPGSAEQVAIKVRGIPVIYDARAKELIVNGHHAPSPMVGDVQRLAIFVDRTTIEVFAGDGLSYIPLPTIPARDDRTFSLTARGGTARIKNLEAYELSSAWKAAKK